MRGLKRNPWLFGLGLLAIPVWFGGQASAEINNDQAGSLVIFPKVVANGERDTVIKLTNRSNMLATAHCFYTNALGTCSDFGNSCINDSDCDGGICEVDWQVTNFDIRLTAQQPTFWRVSTGRFGNLLYPSCTMGSSCSCQVAVNGSLECPGFDAAPAGGVGSIAVPGVGEDFVGELRCYQTTDEFTALPWAGNVLVGEALIQTLSTGQTSAYDAVHITANQAGNNYDLMLDNNEYNACPEQLIFAHRGEGAQRSIAGDTVTFNNELTLVPCSALYEAATPVVANVSFYAYDELEVRVSRDGVPVTCFSNVRLDDPIIFGSVFDANFGNRQNFKTRILVSSDNICLTGDNAGELCSSNADCDGFLTTAGGYHLGCRPSPGVVGVAEEFYSTNSSIGRGHSAWSLTLQGSRSAADIIVVPNTVP